LSNPSEKIFCPTPGTVFINYLFTRPEKRAEREYKRDDSNDDFPIRASLFSGVLVVRVQRRAFDDDEYDHQFWGWN
jgi:hypothetical protein